MQQPSSPRLSCYHRANQQLEIPKLGWATELSGHFLRFSFQVPLKCFEQNLWSWIFNSSQSYPWGRRESDMTGWLNNKNNKIALITGRSKEHQTGTQFTVTVGNVTLPQLFLFYWWARQFGRTHLSSAAIIFIQLWRLLKFPRTRAGEGGWSRMYDGVPCNWRATLSYLQPVAWSQGDGFSLS